MGFIKEPKGVYLAIPPSRLTQKEADEISDFIQMDKLKNKDSKDKMTTKTMIIIRKFNEDHA